MEVVVKRKFFLRIFKSYFLNIKLIKTRITSTIEEERLENLMIIRCEGEPTLDEETLRKAIDELANKSEKF